MSNVRNIQTRIQARASLIARMREMRTEIQQIFIDAEHWNSTHPREVPIDPDPDGTLKRLAGTIDKALSNEYDKEASR